MNLLPFDVKSRVLPTSFVIVALFLAVPLAAAAREGQAGAPTSEGPAGPEIVGVVSFRGSNQAVNEFAYSALVRQLLDLGRVRVVDRSRMEAVLAEQRLQLTGFVDQQTAVRVGRLLGMRWAFVGQIDELTVSWESYEKGGGYYQGRARVTITVLDVESGEAIKVIQATGIGIKDDSEGARFAALESVFGDEVAAALRALFRLEAHVVAVRGNIAYLSVGGEAGVREGLRFRVVRRVPVVTGLPSESGAPGPAGYIVERVGVVQVTRVGEGVSEARILSGRNAIAVGDRLEEEHGTSGGILGAFRSVPVQLTTQGGHKISSRTIELHFRFWRPLSWSTAVFTYLGFAPPPPKPESPFAATLGMGASVETDPVLGGLRAFGGATLDMGIWFQSCQSLTCLWYASSSSALSFTLGAGLEGGVSAVVADRVRLEAGVGYAQPLIQGPWLISGREDGYLNVTDQVDYPGATFSGLGPFLRVGVVW